MAAVPQSLTRALFPPVALAASADAVGQEWPSDDAEFCSRGVGWTPTAKQKFICKGGPDIFLSERDSVDREEVIVRR